jgi:hypothetical protein
MGFGTSKKNKFFTLSGNRNTISELAALQKNINYTVADVRV